MIEQYKSVGELLVELVYSSSLLPEIHPANDQGHKPDRWGKHVRPRVLRPIRLVGERAGVLKNWNREAQPRSQEYHAPEQIREHGHAEDHNHPAK